MEERRKNGEIVEEEDISPPFDLVLHPPLRVGQTRVKTMAALADSLQGSPHTTDMNI